MAIFLYDRSAFLQGTFEGARVFTTVSDLVAALRRENPTAIVLALDKQVEPSLDEIVRSAPQATIAVCSDSIESLAGVYRRHPYILFGPCTNEYRALLLQILPQIIFSAAPNSFSEIAGNSSEISAARSRAQTVASSNATVLIQGETGTGKELFASGIHTASPRKDKPFVAVNCAAIPKELIELEFFGSVKGAFTDSVKTREGYFQAADGGTLFLDEVGELPPLVQSKLLRVLQERMVTPIGSHQAVAVDVRIIAATHRSLEQEVRLKRFRQDLYYRLHVVTIDIPPLRERQEDIPDICKVILGRLAKKHRKPVQQLSDSALEGLQRYHWPGNIRELENVLEQMVVLSRKHQLSADDLPLLISAIGAKSDERFTLPEGYSLKKAQATLEEYLIAKALKATGGNRTHAAKLLEMSHRGLLYKLEPKQAKKKTKNKLTST